MLGAMQTAKHLTSVEAAQGPKTNQDLRTTYTGQLFQHKKREQSLLNSRQKPASEKEEMLEKLPKYSSCIV
jgi:hypothetical protein